MWVCKGVKNHLRQTSEDIWRQKLVQFQIYSQKCVPKNHLDKSTCVTQQRNMSSECKTCASKKVKSPSLRITPHKATWFEAIENGQPDENSVLGDRCWALFPPNKCQTNKFLALKSLKILQMKICKIKILQISFDICKIFVRFLSYKFSFVRCSAFFEGQKISKIQTCSMVSGQIIVRYYS